jgi:hypothetical protein
VIEFSLMSDDAAPITVPDLLSTVRVSRSEGSETGFALTEMVRRHQHLVIKGLPGAGKTTAVRQLAAHFAEDVDAPLPIVVKLPRACAAVADAHDVTVELLVADAVRRAPEGDRPTLTDVLTRELASGFVVLICDGLDECRTRASAVVDGLGRLKEDFGPDAGMIITTRPSASRPARKIGFRELSLLTPGSSDQVQHQVFDAAMADLDLTDENRAGRHAKLAQVQREQPDITGVPLLGNLIALLVALGRDSSVDETVTGLLEAAIEQALSRWERNRGGKLVGGDEISGLLTVDVLWDGFIVIGHLVAEQVTPTLGEAILRVAHVLSESWNMTGRKADVIAGHVVDFWDSTISIFIKDDEGTLAPRSRVFADLADAMWVSKASDSAKEQWLYDLLNDETRSDNFFLAATKDPGIVDLAMQVVTDSDQRRRLVEWLCDAATGLRLNEATIDAMLDTLIADAHSAADWLPRDQPSTDPDLIWSQNRQTQKDGRAWPFVRRAASLPMPPELRAKRDELIAQVHGEPEREFTAAVLAATTDGRYDARLLADNEIDHVKSLLALPSPTHSDPLVEQSRNRYTITPAEPMVSGRPEAVLRAAKVVDQLPEGSADKIAQFLMRAPGTYALDIQSALVSHGFKGPLLEQFAQFKIPTRFTDPTPQATCLGELAEPTHATAADTWWCRELFQLYDLMQVGKTSASELSLASDEPHRSTLIKLARLYCDVNGVDAGNVSAQITYAARQGKSALKHLEWLAFAYEPDESTTRSITTVDAASRALLVAALNSSCQGWGQLAFFVSLAVTDADLTDDLIASLKSSHPWARYWTTLAACKISPDPIGTATRLMQADALTKTAVAKFLAVTDDGSEQIQLLLTSLREDNDLLVKVAASRGGHVDDGATFWTCRCCAKTNDLTAEDCVHCDLGSRPRAEED